MKVSDILEDFDDFMDNKFRDFVKIAWIGDVDGRVLSEIHKIAPESIELPKRSDDEVALHEMYKRIYLLYMTAMAKLSAGETQAYSEIFGEFEAALAIYAKNYIRSRG